MMAPSYLPEAKNYAALSKEAAWISSAMVYFSASQALILRCELTNNGII
jgi:hypothetical protein